MALTLREILSILTGASILHIARSLMDAGTILKRPTRTEPKQQHEIERVRTSLSHARLATMAYDSSKSPISPADIAIPAELAPNDGRFGCGPSKFRPEAAHVLADRAVDYLGTSHRRDTVRDVVGELRTGLADLFSLPDGYEVLLGNGGATAFWDMASFGLIERRSHHLVLGEFSSKFTAVTTSAPHLEDPSVTQAEPGDSPPLEAVDGVDAYCYPHNETSTGVTVKMSRPVRVDEALMLVDATSSAGALRVDLTLADVYYFSPQKALSSDGGLWIALLSPAAVERVERISASGRWTPAFFNLATALSNSRKNQTYNTPALATLFLTAQQVGWMNRNGGLEWAASRCDRSSEILYGWADASEIATPFVTDPTLRSRATATIDFDDRVNADTISAVLRANGIVDTESYRKLGRNQLRIGMFPAVEPDDVTALTACIDYVMDRLIG